VPAVVDCCRILCIASGAPGGIAVSERLTFGPTLIAQALELNGEVRFGHGCPLSNSIGLNLKKEVIVAMKSPKGLESLAVQFLTLIATFKR